MVANSRNERGAALIEFVLISMVWVPLLLGTLAIGTNLIRDLQAIQFTRDAGNMYAYGVDFTQAGNAAILERLGKSLDFNPSGSGPGVVIFSTVTYIGRYQCKALGWADNSDPPVPDTSPGHCVNWRHFVFVQQFTLGNPSVGKGNFGSPAGINPAKQDAKGFIDMDEYASNPGARAGGFHLIPAPPDDGETHPGYQPGQLMYIAESRFQAIPFPGFTAGLTIYSHAIF
jgi:hypothetical protein